MVKAKFFKDQDNIREFIINGHANAADYGNDLVCAAVTAIVSGSLNAIDIEFKNKTDIKVDENTISIKVKDNSNELQIALRMMFNQLKTIDIQYPKNFKIEEVS